MWKWWCLWMTLWLYQLTNMTRISIMRCPHTSLGRGLTPPDTWPHTHTLYPLTLTRRINSQAFNNQLSGLKSNWLGGSNRKLPNYTLYLPRFDTKMQNFLNSSLDQDFSFRHSSPRCSSTSVTWQTSISFTNCYESILILKACSSWWNLLWWSARAKSGLVQYCKH